MTTPTRTPEHAPAALPQPEAPRDQAYVLTGASFDDASGLSLDVPVVTLDWNSVRQQFADAFPDSLNEFAGTPAAPQHYSTDSSEQREENDEQDEGEQNDGSNSLQVELLGMFQEQCGKWLCSYAAMTPGDYGTVYIGESDILATAEEAVQYALKRLMDNAAIDQGDTEAEEEETQALLSKIETAFQAHIAGRQPGTLQFYFEGPEHHYTVAVHQIGFSTDGPAQAQGTQPG